MEQNTFPEQVSAPDKRSSLVRKLSSVNRITVFFTVIVCGFALAVFFYRILTAQHEQSTKASASGFQLLLEDYGLRAEGAAASIAGRPDVVQAARNRSHTDAYKILSKLNKLMHVDFIVLTDTNGNIIARGHSERFGDNIINQKPLKKRSKGARRIRMKRRCLSVLQSERDVPSMTAKGGSSEPSFRASMHRPPIF